ncbi:phosphotransferase family protein [Nocardioides sp. YIM 152315]|uniref:phosphotransferase family protein n=1 Tax=Nocardioides sp. YIM 152315 TaxID=3031760 RepID=UPI0023DCAAE5|nr:phosphotransferase family protein [Nocardioides sp. YIM 152315]MDF1602110.1 phosphotransferase family protein [Nocardioides sp. YIM 152315]
MSSTTAAADELAPRLRDLLAAALDDPSLRIDHLRRLPAGASRHTWSFSAGGDRTDSRELILRMDAPGSMSDAMDRETALMVAAGAVGVPSPAVVAASAGATDLGAAYVVMSRVEGESIPRRILRDAAYAAARPVLAAQCGRALARIHTIDPAAVPGLQVSDELAAWRAVLDEHDQPHPAFELAIRWLEEHRPAPAEPRVVHGDFRNGNLIVGPEGIRAVLDWELAHLGDPLEDLGWLCVRAWRFGEEPVVGGFGSVDELVAAYEAESGTTVDRDALHWWHVLGTLKWGIICIHQTERHRSGATRSVELATIGRRVAENEWDLLQLLP